MYGLPRSMWWFIATAIIFVLQWIPFTGIFLMLVLAPFWSIFTINAGFVALGIEAATGRTSRLWLIAPLAWFGGDAIAAQLSERAYASLDAEIRAGNAASSRTFDPALSVIVVKENANDLGSAAQSLMQNYRLPVVYSATGSDRKTRRTNELPSLDTAYRAYRVAGAETCNRLRDDAQLRQARAYGHVIREGRGRQSASTGLCSYTLPEEPIRPGTLVEAKGEKLNSLLLAGRIVRVTITAPDGSRSELRSGQAAPLRWLPMPGIGCALNSGAPSWSCFANFMTQSPRGLGGQGAWGRATIDVIAGALGLEPEPALMRRNELAATDTSALDALLQRHEGAALANLDRLLADPSKRATVHDLAGLAERPHLLVPRADSMLVAMTAAFANGDGNSESARNLQRLIAALPDGEFQRIGPGLLGRLDEGRPVPQARKRSRPRERIDGNLALRLADLGEPARPLLERLALTPRGDSAASAILGLCRLGSPPPDLATRLAEHILEDTAPSSETRAAAYVTLVLWARTDLAEKLIDDKGRNRRDYERRWPGLAEEAGIEFCALQIKR